MTCNKNFSQLPNAPNPPLEDVRTFLVNNYDFPIDITTIVGERNLIAFPTSEDGKRYVVKIFSRAENTQRIDAEVRVMNQLHRKYPDVYPAVLRSRNGDLTEFCVIHGEDHYAWVMEFREGLTLAETPRLPSELLSDIGDHIGKLSVELTSVNPLPFQTNSNWAPHCAAIRIENALAALPTDVKPLVEEVLQRYQSNIEPIKDALPRMVIHGDLNDGNILIQRRRVSAIVDFGDMLKTYRICELANALPYFMMGRKSNIGILSTVTGAYVKHVELTEQELNVLIDFILLRLGLSLTLSYVQQEHDPDNPQLSVSRKPVKQLLLDFIANPDMIEACRRASIKYAPE